MIYTEKLLRSVQSDYSHAIPDYATVKKYISEYDGKKYVVIDLCFHIGTYTTKYHEKVIYNLTDGGKYDYTYFKTLASRAFGTSKLNYLSMHSEVLNALTSGRYIDGDDLRGKA